MHVVVKPGSVVVYLCLTALLLIETTTSQECIVSASQPTADDSPKGISEQSVAPPSERIVGQLRRGTTPERLEAIHRLSELANPIAFKALVSCLKDRVPEVGQAAFDALWAMRHQADVGPVLLTELRAEASAKQPRSTALVPMTAIACGAADADILHQLLGLATSSERSTSVLFLDGMMQGLERMATEQDGRIAGVLGELEQAEFYRTNFALRRCAVDAAARTESKACIGYLVRELDRSDGELRGAIVRHLQRTTRKEFGIDARAWSQWWKEHESEFEFPADFGYTEVKDAQRLEPHYYDIPIRGKRVLFVLDSSKSMGAGRKVSRLDAAKRELIRTLENLPETTLFSVVVFNQSVSTWQERLTPATPGWKAHASAYVQSLRPQGKTATYDALQAALNLDANLEAIYFLSDGAPSAGSLTNPDRLREAIGRQNRLRRVSIYTIGVFGGGPEVNGFETFMKRLAQDNYGQYHRAD